ncbi:hypothetical protein PTKIN_Ptkin08bG0058700 [Pterospermum kingtungense]
MAPSFIFEAPIDEEPELSESKDEDNEEAGEEEKGDEAENKPSNPNANLNPHGISLLTPNPSQKNTLDVVPPPSISKYPKSSSKTPLQLRACETLGYTKPTPIQVAVGHPFDTVKGTLQKHNTEVQGIKYRNGLHCAARILATEGCRMQVQGTDSLVPKSSSYSSPLDCAIKTIKSDGAPSADDDDDLDLFGEKTEDKKAAEGREVAKKSAKKKESICVD